MVSLQNNITRRLCQRELKELSSIEFQRHFQVTPDLIGRLGLEKELEGHGGCVNCLEWNVDGSLLASGSDDCNVILWDPHRHKKLTAIQTRHHGNIFSVKFLPNSNDATIVSGAADCKIRVHDIRAQETTHVFGCHAGRVKRLAVAPNVPFMFWSAAEDGTVMQFDLREPEMAYGNNPNNVLVNLNAYLGPHAEAKCISINPLRPEQIAVGANDPYVRVYDRRKLSCQRIMFPGDNSGTSGRSPWERQNMLSMFSFEENFPMPKDSATYFVAGHLPQKQKDYKKRYRTLAATYVTFGPDGSELLVNLGGEQIYLFDVNRGRPPQKLELPISAFSNGIVKEASCAPTNGFSMHRNGTTNGVTANGVTANGVTNGVSKHFSTGASFKLDDNKEENRKNIQSHKYQSKPLPPAAEALKSKANSVFEKQQYTIAISLYNKALQIAPGAAVLYGNRAAAYMKRGWDGDLYSALRDCHMAITLDPHHLKAHFRLARCLYELAWTKEAFDCLMYFKSKFPDYAKSHACEALDRDIKAAIFSKTEDETSKNKPDSPKKSNRRPEREISELEQSWQNLARDYELRFCGHCNTTTDIKEANFFGSNGQFVVAGSDDGSFFIWEKSTTNILRVLRGDDSIVNCLQPHPSSCLLATSGIDPVVRLWSPRPDDGKKDEREVDNSDDAASANQRRMNADPLEVMLMNMGYRITGVLDGDEEDEGRGDTAVHCRPS